MKYISETVPWKSFRAKGDGRGSVCTSHNPSNLFSVAGCGVLLLDQRCRVRHGQAPIYHSFTHDCLPHLQTCCFTASLFFLALAASLLASLRGASWLLDPCLLSFLVQLPLCLFASLIAWCLPSAADTIGQFCHFALSPISTFLIFINRVPCHCFQWYLSSFLIFSDEYRDICFSQITFRIAFSDVTFSDVTLINYYHDLSVFISLSFRSQAAITAQKMLTEAFYLSFQSLSLSQAITFDCSVTPSGLPSHKQRWVIKCIEPARKV